MLENKNNVLEPVLLKRKFIIDFQDINWKDIKFKSNREVTLLIVDDERSFRELLYDIFESEGGYTIDLAENGQEGYDKFKEKKHDIVLTDIMMDIMTGVEMAEYIRRLRPNQKIFFFSGWLSKNQLVEKFQEEFDSGFFQFIDKPFDITNFQNRVYLFKNQNIANIKLNVLDKEQLFEIIDKLNPGQLFAVHKEMWELIHQLYENLLNQKFDDSLLKINNITNPEKLLADITLSDKYKSNFYIEENSGDINDKLTADILHMADFLIHIYDRYCKMVY